MVRKQLYISDEHERVLKARARELGVSEAELVRRMLDGLLLDGEGGRGATGPRAAEALEGFLQEARRLMLGEDLDVAGAGGRVGYSDASQFTREYKRLFGAPPARDVVRLREAAMEGVSA